MKYINSGVFYSSHFLVNMFDPGVACRGVFRFFFPEGVKFSHANLTPELIFGSVAL